MQSYEKTRAEQNNQFIFMPSAFKIMTNSTLYTAEPPRVVTETVSMTTSLYIKYFVTFVTILSRVNN